MAASGANAGSVQAVTQGPAFYKWQQAAQTPVAAAAGAHLDPATAAELRQLRALARRQAQELEILKKAVAIFSQTPDQ